LKYCCSSCHPAPKPRQCVAVRSDSTVTAGAPVKPDSANNALLTPTIAPQPEPSLTMVGWSMQRIIWLRGPWYSAMPSACRVVSTSSRSNRATAAATPSAFQAPEVW